MSPISSPSACPRAAPSAPTVWPWARRSRWSAGPTPEASEMTDRSPSGFDLTPPTEDQRARLEADLNDEEREVLLRHGTEAPFCGGLLGNKSEGVYGCRECGLPLFLSKTKFESGTGWPSF